MQNQQPPRLPPSKNTSNSIASSPKNSARRTKRGNSTTKPSTKGLSKLTTSRVTLGGSISHCSSSKTNCNGSCKPKPRPLRFLHFLLRQRRQLHRLARRLEHAIDIILAEGAQFLRVRCGLYPGFGSVCLGGQQARSAQCHDGSCMFEGVHIDSCFLKHNNKTSRVSPTPAELHLPPTPITQILHHQRHRHGKSRHGQCHGHL